MLISFIIPAHNEAGVIRRTIEGLRAAADACDLRYELLVVDDASTDRTSEIASSLGARVVPVERRQIAAVRNAGAEAADGDVFVFVDADTLVSAPTLRQMMHALDGGAVAGGARFIFDRPVPLLVAVLARMVMSTWIIIALAPGCFVFARRAAFVAVGGFDERYFAGEEIFLSLALRRQGRFKLIHHPVITSARKAMTHSNAEILKTAVSPLLRGIGALQRREGLEIWYDGRREANAQATGDERSETPV